MFLLRVNHYNSSRETNERKLRKLDTPLGLSFSTKRISN